MKLSLDALKERAGATASMDLLATISGGTANACHDTGATGILEIDQKKIIVKEPVVIDIGPIR